MRQLDIGFDYRRIELADIDVHAGAGLQDIDRQQPDNERHRGHHLEIDDRLDGDAADARHVGHVRDAGHHGAEDDRRDQHADELDESVAERAHADGGIGRRHAERDAGRHADKHPDPKLGPPRPAAAGLGGQGGCRGHGRSPCEAGPRADPVIPGRTESASPESIITIAARSAPIKPFLMRWWLWIPRSPQFMTRLSRFRGAPSPEASMDGHVKREGRGGKWKPRGGASVSLFATPVSPKPRPKESQKNKGSGTPTNAVHENHRTLRCGARLARRARLSAFHRGSRLRESSSQRLSFRPGFLGRSLNGRYPPSPVPVQRAPRAPVIMPGD